MKGGYWHIPIEKKHRYKTAFGFEGVSFQCNVLPFGLTCAPPYFF